MKTTNSNWSSDRRLRLVTRCIALASIVIISRLFFWQIIKGPSLSTLADRQHQELVYLSGERGEILDANGSLLVGTKNLFHLYGYKPQMDKDIYQIINLLTPIIATIDGEASPGAILDVENFLKSRLQLNSNWISIKHYLDGSRKKLIESLNIKGLGFEDEFVRLYPGASLSAHILGFVGSDLAGEPQGYFGLEGYFDRQLRGREGKLLAEKDAFGNPILIGRYDFLKNITGRTIVTTIDKNIQYLVEKLLKTGLEKYQAKAGNVIIMDTKSGAIVSMAALPNYDPGHFSDFENTSYRNPTIANLFEPGSIFKVLVMAAALNEKVITPDTVCDICSSALSIGQFTIKTWNDTYHDNSTMTDVIVHSDNIGMVFVSRKLGKQKFTDYLNRFGFGKTTGIQLQEEISGQVKTSEDLKDIDLATNSFGQGIAVTPIQMVTAVNAIANDGYLISPTIIKRITSGNKEIAIDQPIVTKVIDPQAANLMRTMMVAAVDLGEAKWAKPKGVEIAGKTGTAQIPIQGHYDPEKTIASFVGFFPARNPKYTMLVSLTEPKTSTWGSETAAPLWFDIARQLLLQN